MDADGRDAQPVALVSGVNRGAGFKVRRQLAREGVKVFPGTRDPEKDEAAGNCPIPERAASATNLPDGGRMHVLFRDVKSLPW